MNCLSRYQRVLNSAVCFCFLAAMVSTAAAAEDAVETEDEAGVEEVIVTARKRAESLQEVPVVISVLSSEQLERYSVNSLETLAASSPQLFVGRASNGSGAQITLRGVGSQATSIGIEQSAAVVVDEVYYPSGFFLNEAMFDLDTIELMRGPQALFFGKNATAGVISFNTASPTEEFEALARVGYEFAAEDLSGEGVISGPITPNLLGRLSVHASTMSGDYFDNVAVPIDIGIFDLATGAVTFRTQQPNHGGMPGSENIVVRGTLVWTPTEQLTATLKTSVSSKEDDSNAWNYVPYSCQSGYTQPNPAVRCEKIFDVHVPNAPEGYGGNLPDMKADGSPFNDYESFSITADFDYQLDSASITSVFNYHTLTNVWGLGQNVESSTSFIAATQNSSFDAFSNETRYLTEFDGPFNFMLGFYYQDTKRDHTQAGAFAPLEDSSLPPDRRFVSYIKPSETDGETISGFGQVTWQATDQVELAAGVRYIHETKDSFLNQSYVQWVLQGLFPQDQPITADQSFTDWTPEVTLTYFATEDFMMYGGYKSAYKSGGFSNSALISASTVPSDVTFEPETADGFEVGFKSTFLDNQIRFNAALYSFKYKNLQVDYFDSITFQFITTNAGSARVEGVELESNYAPSGAPGLLLSGNINYNKAKYLDYIAPCYSGQSISAGCNTTFGSGFGQDLSGTPLAMAPEWTGLVGALYEMGFASNLMWEVGSNLRYSSSYGASSFGSPLAAQDSYWNLDATLRIFSQDDRWEIAVIARNLTDEWHVSGGLPLPNSGSGTGTSQAVPADEVGLVDLPRTVQVRYTQRF